MWPLFKSKMSYAMPYLETALDICSGQTGKVARYPSRLVQPFPSLLPFILGAGWVL